MSRFVIRDVVVKSLSDWRLWLLHVVANPLLAALFVGWLFIPESHVWQLGLSLPALLVLIVLALALHAGTLTYLAERQQSRAVPLVAAWTRAFRHLVAFAVCAAAAYFLWRQVNRLDAYRIMLPAYLRSMMPATVRRHLTLAVLTNAYATLLFILRWIVSSALLLPSIAAVAHLGLRGFSEAWSVTGKAIRSGSYWLTIACVALAGVWLTGHLIAWRPLAVNASVARESTSMVVRFCAAYVTALASWLVTCSLLGRTLLTADVTRQTSA